MYDDNNEEFYIDLTTLDNGTRRRFDEIINQEIHRHFYNILEMPIILNENNTTRFDHELHNMDNFCELDLTKNIPNIPKDHRVIIETLNKQIDLDHAIHDWSRMGFKTASYVGQINYYYKNSLRLLMINQETFKPDFKGDAITFVKDRTKNPKLFR